MSERVGARRSDRRVESRRVQHAHTARRDRCNRAVESLPVPRRVRRCVYAALLRRASATCFGGTRKRWEARAPATPPSVDRAFHFIRIAKSVVGFAAIDGRARPLVHRKIISRATEGQLCVGARRNRDEPRRFADLSGTRVVAVHLHRERWMCEGPLRVLDFVVLSVDVVAADTFLWHPNAHIELTIRQLLLLVRQAAIAGPGVRVELDFAVRPRNTPRRQQKREQCTPRARHAAHRKVPRGCVRLSHAMDKSSPDEKP